MFEWLAKLNKQGFCPNCEKYVTSQRIGSGNHYCDYCDEPIHVFGSSEKIYFQRFEKEYLKLKKKMKASAGEK